MAFSDEHGSPCYWLWWLPQCLPAFHGPPLPFLSGDADQGHSPRSPSVYRQTCKMNTHGANRCPVISFHTNAFTSDWELKETKHNVGFSRVQLCTLCDRHSVKMQKSLRGMTKMQKRVIISTRWKNTKVTTCARQYRPKLKVFMFCPVEEVHVRTASNQDGITSNIYHSIVHVQNFVDQLMRKTN